MPKQTAKFVEHLRMSVARWKMDIIHFENVGAYHLARQVREWLHEAEDVLRRYDEARPGQRRH